MKLTRIQLKTLEFFQRSKTQAPTLGGFLAANRSAFLQLLAIGGLGYATTLFVPPMFGWLMMGIALGAILREIGRFRATRLVWPLYQEVINWTKVADLLEAHEKHDAQAGPRK